MNKALIAFAAAMLVAGSASASDKTDIMAVLNQWNDTDATKAAAACADEASVVDDIPPYEWRGPGACTNWAKDFDAFAQRNGIAEPKGTLGQPKQLVVTGNRAYVVVPATFAYTAKGKPVKDTATATFVLQRTSAGWRITAWTWATLSTS